MTPMTMRRSKLRSLVAGLAPACLLLVLAACDVSNKTDRPDGATGGAAPEGAAAAQPAPAGAPTTDLGAPEKATAPTPTPTAPGTTTKSASTATPVPPAPAGDDEQLVVLTLPAGQVLIDLDDAAAPRHSANFRKLVASGFYNGKSFHRVIAGFVAQGGDPEPRGTGQGSFGDNLEPEIRLPHVRGAVAMARQNDDVNPKRLSNGSQFYICLEDLPSMNALGYTVFGKVVGGMDVVAKIQKGDLEVNDGLVPPDQRTVISSAELKTFPKQEVVILETNIGEIVVDVFEEATPKHAENFKKLAREGFYDNLTFHRVIDGFMAQGGDPQGDGSGGPGYTIPAEIRIEHRRGSLAAARQGDQVNPQRNSSGSQFYICFAPQPSLDAGGYTVFGHVVKGMAVVDKITRGNRVQNGLVPSPQRTRILKARIAEMSGREFETPSPAR